MNGGRVPDDPVRPGAHVGTTFSAIYRRCVCVAPTSAISDRSSTASGRPGGASDGVIVLDAKNRIEWMNERAVVLLALDPQGTPPADRQPRAQSDFQRYAESGDFREP